MPKKIPDNLSEQFNSLSVEKTLQERIKELTCLYKITQLMMQYSSSPETIFRGIACLIPPAWQFPEKIVGRMVIDGREYITETSIIQPSFPRQTGTIIVGGQVRGLVEAIIVREIEEGAVQFLPEEQNLIDAIARHIGFYLERFKAEEEKDVMQKQLMHADRLVTIGQLAAGIAHEINEPLNNILGFAQLAKKHESIPPQVAQDLDKIVDSSLNAREIIKKLLLFSRQTPAHKNYCDINSIIKEGLHFLKGRCKQEGIDLILSLSSDVPQFLADAGQVNQVVINLVVNAIQAMPHGGTLTVRTSVVMNSVRIEVIDTGIGMDKDTVAKIFLPFFTTKDIHQGTGLGLSVVHGIVTAHGGSITVDSQPQVGTSFSVYLPLNLKGDMESNDAAE